MLNSIIAIVVGTLPAIWMVYRVTEKKETGWLIGIVFYFLPVLPLILYLLDQNFPSLFR